jgi:hypothetical protein
MIIETKHNINDEVWVLYDDKVLKGKIQGINLVKSKGTCPWVDGINYFIKLTGLVNNYVCNENKIFKTKQELLDSL